MNEVLTEREYWTLRVVRMREENEQTKARYEEMKAAHEAQMRAINLTLQLAALKLMVPPRP